MNRRILLSATTILASLTLVVGGTFAFFSDEETSSNNIFAAGTLDLKLDDENEVFADSITTSFNTEADPLAPGESYESFISLHNDGSIDIGKVILAADRSESDTATTLPSVLHLTSVRTGSDSECTEGVVDLTTDIETGIANGIAPATLQELIDTSGFDALPGLAVDEDYFLCMEVTMDEEASNEHQGTTARVDFLFTAHQTPAP